MICELKMHLFYDRSQEDAMLLSLFKGVFSSRVDSMSSHHCRCYVMRLPSFSPADELDMLSLSSCLSAAKKIANLNTNISLLSVDGGCGVFGCVVCHDTDSLSQSPNDDVY
jgi:hypothetical protein